MANEKVKTVAVKFAANTVTGGKVHLKDAIAELPEADAKTLIDGKHAVAAPKAAAQ